MQLSKDMVLTRFSPSDISFTKALSASEYSARFLIHIQGKPYFLKVHHGCGPKEPWENDLGRETDIHICEANAYKRLKKHGLCDRGIGPKFYGSIEHIDPKLFTPHLNMFLQDDYPARAILLEYVPNMVPLDYQNYTRARVDKFLEGIRAIHAAGVVHMDIYPRNMMVFDDSADPKRERAIWVDFNRAQTLDMNNPEPRYQEWLEFEYALAAETVQQMKADSEKGALDQTAQYYWGSG